VGVRGGSKKNRLARLPELLRGEEEIRGGERGGERTEFFSEKDSRGRGTQRKRKIIVFSRELLAKAISSVGDVIKRSHLFEDGDIEKSVWGGTLQESSSSYNQRADEVLKMG